MTEKDFLVRIRAAHSLNAIAELLDALTDLAAFYIERGETQEGADVLAFVLQQTNAAPDTQEAAHVHWEDLERYICPRVLLDAEDFAAKATLNDLIEYVFAGV